MTQVEQLTLLTGKERGYQGSPVGGSHPYPLTPQSSIGRAVEWFEAEMRTKGYSSRTIKLYVVYATRFAAFVGHNTHVSAITADNVRAFAAHVAAKARSAKTKELMITAVRTFFRLLAEAGKIDRNPAEKVYPEKAPRRVPRIPTDTQYRRLLTLAQQADNKALYPIIVLAGELGLRTGEIRALTWESFELDNPYRPLVRIHYDNPKHAAKERAIEGSPDLAAALREYQQHRNGDEKLFPWEARTLQAWVSKLGRKAGLPFRLTLQSLRWRAIWKAHERGMSPSRMQRFFGLSPLTYEKETKPVLQMLSRAMNPA